MRNQIATLVTSDEIWWKITEIRDAFENHVNNIAKLQQLIEAEDEKIFCCLDEEERLLQLLKQSNAE